MQQRRPGAERTEARRPDPARRRRRLGMTAAAAALLTSVATAGFDPAEAAGTLTVDYGVSISSVTEEDAPIARSLTIFLDGPAPAGGVEVQATLVDGTALESSDFEAFSEPLVIPEGGTDVSFTISVLGDTVPEPDEIFTIELLAVTAGVTIATPSLPVTINDDDGALPAAGGFRITQEIDPPSADDGTAFFYIVECSRGLTALGGRAVGPVVGDGTVLEITTMFSTPLAIGDVCFVTPSGPSATPLPAGWAATPSARTSVTVGEVGSTGLTVTMRPVPPSGFRIVQEIDPPSAADGTPYFYALNCSRGPAGIGGRVLGPLVGDGSELVVTAINSTPLAAGDSCEVTPVGTVSAGAIPAGWSVSPAGTAVVTAGDPTSVVLTYTWQPTGPPPPVLRAVSVGAATVIEGNSGSTSMVFTLTLDGPATGNESVTVNTADKTANAGSDYTALTNRVVTFPAGATAGSVTVTVNGDGLVEADELLTVTLTDAQNLKIALDEGLGTITNDDSTPPPPPPPVGRTIVIGDASVAEGNHGSRTMSFTLTLDGPAVGNERVEVDSVDGSARRDSDYARIKDLVVKFPAGATTRTVTVKVFGDKQPEADETFSLALSKPGHVAVVDTEGIGTILDDDSGAAPATKPTVSVDPASVVEGDHGTVAMTVTVRLSAPSSESVKVELETDDDEAKEGRDYVEVDRKLTFAPGQTVITTTVLVKGDTKKEGNEHFELELEDPKGATLTAAGREATATIVDDD